MSFLQKIAQRLLLVVQFILVFLFILFEEIIWEGIAKPIYQKVQSLRILQNLQTKIEKFHRYVVLVLFSILLLGVEGAGLVAGVFFVQGKVILGTVLYVAKIPIAAFTFWLFKVARDKLLSFRWFAWSYYRLMEGIDWLQSRTIYKRTLEMLFNMKVKTKKIFKEIKEKYFAKDSRFISELKSFYRYIKNFKNRNNQ
ncbi:MAG: hypothetical protein K0U38_00145 [Epsilonproteobacteria bacterium]|nr:hypothetical protein [Campylobacterota bacterium]